MTYIKLLRDIECFNKANVNFGQSLNGYGHSYFARRDFDFGEIVMKGYGRIINHQTEKHSMQIGKSEHFLPRKWTGKYWNHSCNPNAFVKSRSDNFPNLIAKRKIKQGEEITYAYYTSEFEWTIVAHENFVTCSCHDKKCNGKIFSFSQLTISEQKKLIESGQLTKYLKHL